jgi:hypothetical protein
MEQQTAAWSNPFSEFTSYVQVRLHPAGFPFYTKLHRHQRKRKYWITSSGTNKTPGTVFKVLYGLKHPQISC